MKKKIFSVLTAASVAAASLLCFACDGDTPPEREPEGPVKRPSATEMLRQGVQGLYEADGFEAELAATLKSKNDATGTKYECSLEKAGRRMRVSAYGEYIVDLDTGYAYTSGETSTTFSQVFPASAYGYIVKLIDEEADGLDENEIANIAYDEDGNVVVSVDIKDEVNKYTEPFRMTYNGGTLVSLINEFLVDSDTTLQELLQAMGDAIVSNKDMSASFIVLTIDTQLRQIVPDLTVKKLFRALGITDEQYAAVNSRTAGEFAEGMLSLPSKISELLPSEGGVETVDAKQIAQTVFDALFVDDVDTTNVEEDVKSLKDDIVSLLGGVKVADVVNKLCEKLESDDLKEMIANNVSFTTLGMSAKVSFDGNAAVSAVELTANAKHDCVGTSTGILNDNDFSVSCELKLSDYTSAATPIALPDDLAAFDGADIVAVAHDETAAVYIETGSTEGELTITSVTSNGEPCDESKVTYNGETHVLTFDRELIRSVEAETASDVTLEGTIDGKTVTVVVYVLPDISWKSLADAVKNNG